MAAYYNEFDPFAAAWLRELIKGGHIAPGEVDERSIKEVKADDLKGFKQCHFFAGIGGWSYALRLAGWDDARPVWTGSCPCQPYSTGGKRKGQADDRHLWPHWFGLIRESKPAIIFGEQVASAITYGWLDGVANDMEAENYAIGSAVLPACATQSPQYGERLFFVGQAQHNGQFGVAVDGGSNKTVQHDAQEAEHSVESPRASAPGVLPYENIQWRKYPDGKLRAVKPGIHLLAHGVSNRVGKLRGYGNAIVPQVAAQFIKATEGIIKHG